MKIIRSQTLIVPYTFTWYDLTGHNVILYMYDKKPVDFIWNSPDYTIPATVTWSNAVFNRTSSQTSTMSQWEYRSYIKIISPSQITQITDLFIVYVI